MKKYYFLLCSLPRLYFDKPLDITFEEFSKRLIADITKQDEKKIYLLKQYIDIKNLRPFWERRPIDWKGNLHEKQLEEAMLVENFFPSFVFDFLRSHEDVTYRLKHFSYLIVRFLQMAEKDAKGLLKWYFSFERKMKIALTALRAKLLQRDIRYELQYEDPYDFLVKDLFEKSIDGDIAVFDIALQKIYENNYANPLVLQKKLLEFIFENIEREESHWPNFSIDHVIAYMLKLMMVEEWQKLDEIAGKNLVEALI